MKKKFPLLFSFLLPLLVYAQNNEGVIVYKQTINMHRNLPNEQMKQYIPEFQTYESELMFKGKTTLFKPKKSDQPDAQQQHQMGAAGGEGPGFRMMSMRRRDNTVVYRDLEANTQIEATNFMDKDFLVEGIDSANVSGWKVTGKQKMVAGYPCLSATRSDSLMGRPREITAWFTPAIPIQAGPQSFGGLPGMILEIDMNQGQTVTTATSVQFKTLEEGMLVMPDKGKKVTREEFRKLVDERMKEMRQMGGGPGGPGGGGVFIIRN